MYEYNKIVSGTNSLERKSSVSEQPSTTSTEVTEPESDASKTDLAQR